MNVQNIIPSVTLNNTTSIVSDVDDDLIELEDIENYETFTQEDLNLLTTKFEISNINTKSKDTIVYAENQKYHTIKYLKGEKKLEADFAYIEATKYISEKEVALWKSSVERFIDEYNSKIVSMDDEDNEDIKIEYKILDVDENFAYKFEKYINGKLEETGEQWYKNVKTKVEKKAWRKAVKAYNKKNGIKMPTDDIKKLIDDLMSIIDKLDDGLPELPSTDNLILPMMELAIPTATTDPCKFIEQITKAIEGGITSLNGIPNPKEVATYMMKNIKHTISTAAQTLVQSKKTIIKAAAEPIIEPLSDDDFLEAYEELDIQSREIKKSYQEEWVVLKTCATEDVIQFKTEESTSAGEGGTTNLDGIEPVDNLPGVTADGLYKAIAATGRKKEKNGKVYVNKAPTGTIHENIVYSINKCYIPLMKGWYAYCDKQGWLKDGWDNFKWNITSGYRSSGNGKSSDTYNYNYSVGGAATSAHAKGFAIDVTINAKNMEKYQSIDIISKLCDFCYSYAIEHKIPFDQILHECNNPLRCESSNNWMHLGAKNNDKYRGQYYTRYNPSSVYKSDGKTKELHNVYKISGNRKEFSIKNTSFA